MTGSIEFYIGVKLAEEIGENDPIQYLTSLKLHEQLNKIVPNKEENRKIKLKI